VDKHAGMCVAMADCMGAVQVQCDRRAYGSTKFGTRSNSPSDKRVGRASSRCTANSEPYRPENPQLKPRSQRRHGVGASWLDVGMSWRDAEHFRRLARRVSPLLLDFLLKVTTPFPKAGKADEKPHCRLVKTPNAFRGITPFERSCASAPPQAVLPSADSAG